MMRKAQVLLFVLFFLLILGVLVSALAVMWRADIQTRISEREAFQAFYLAQAGVAQGKIWARYNPMGPFPYNSGWVTLGTGRYRFTVDTVMGNLRNIQVTGQVLDSMGQPSAERRITVEVDINTSAPGDEVQQPWTWREI
ncbi:hypothetical protein DRO38_04375 [Candidatus Bathyarchaeota archaeon]|nr:MAG: hypothetical protein DRO38_04375 [Candidatus Bathyarchaeota archaeon]